MYLLSMGFGKNDLLQTQLVTNCDSNMIIYYHLKFSIKNEIL